MKTPQKKAGALPKLQFKPTRFSVGSTEKGCPLTEQALPGRGGGGVVRKGL